MKPILVLAIGGYRRWLSGKGPLSRVRCTFEATESCSRYGLRIVARSGLVASALAIRARLHLCRDASVYRDDVALHWGPVYDDLDPARLEDALDRRDEAPETISAVLLSAARVARHRGEIESGRALLRRAAARGGWRLPARVPQLVQRNLAGLRQAPRRRLVRAVVVALLLGAAFTAVAIAAGAAGLGVPCGALLAAWLSARAALQFAAARARVDRLDASRAFQVASSSTAPMNPGW